MLMDVEVSINFICAVFAVDVISTGQLSLLCEKSRNYWNFTNHNWLSTETAAGRRSTRYHLQHISKVCM